MGKPKLTTADGPYGAGDVNGDGLADLIIGAYKGDPNDIGAAGKSYVVFGQKETTAQSVSDS